MVSMAKRVAVDKNEGLELDPQLWQELPEDVLVHVIGKLPFFTVVDFRRVCKLWRADIIPRAASHVQASNESTLLYFDFRNRDQEESNRALLYFDFRNRDREESNRGKERKLRGTSWWMRLCPNVKSSSRSMQVWNPEIEWAGSIHEFQHNSLPLLSHDEVPELRISEQGLLFFALTTWADKKCTLNRRMQQQVVKEIVVCNPLTAQSKILGLPCPLYPPCTYFEQLTGAEVLLGTVFDSKTEGYRLVAAGVNAANNFVTLLYDSLTCAWTKGPSLLRALLEAGNFVVDVFPWAVMKVRTGIKVRTGHSRVVSCNNNLFWYASVELGNWDHVIRREFMLKFDFHPDSGAWSFIPVPDPIWKSRTLKRLSQMALVEGKILLWHLYMDWYVLNRIGNRLRHRDGPSRIGLQLKLTPEINWIQQDIWDRADDFLGATNGLSVDKYMAFSQGDFVYHVLKMCAESHNLVKSPKIVVQDTRDNSCKRLILPLDRLLSHAEFSVMKVWSFSASLTSSP